jgi:hypothetical protein
MKKISKKHAQQVSGPEKKIKVFKENQLFLRKRGEIITSQELLPPTQI